MRSAGGGRGPRGAPLAAGLRAVAFLAAVRAAGAWRFGISLSLTGTFEPDYTRGTILNTTCTHCPNVLTALNLTEAWASTSGHLLGSSVSWDVREDGSDLATCLANYVAMAQDPSIHALLGPAYVLWNQEVEEAVAPFGKVLIKWSFDMSVYPNHPTSTHTTDFEALIKSEIQAQEALPQSAAVDMSTILPGNASTTGATSSRFSFDVNIPQKNWMYDVIDLIGPLSQTFMFLWFDDFPGSYRFERQCVEAFRYVVSQGGSASFLPLHFYSQFADELGAVMAMKPGALGFCGHDFALQSLLVSMETTSFLPPVFFVGQPLGETPMLSERAHTMNYVVEPIPIAPPDLKRPDPLFGDLLHFWQAWWSATLKTPTYEAYQVVGATSLLLESLRAIAADPSSFSSAALAAQIRRSRTATVIGWLSFDASGERAPGPDAMGTTRQLMPLPEGYALVRFLISAMVLVSPVAKDSCEGEVCRSAFKDRITVFTGGWRGKRVQVNPCAPGCHFKQLACLPCPTGTYRTATDWSCKPCDSAANTYADVPGSETCSPCPVGADCSNPAGPILTQPGQCRVQPWSGSCASHPHNYTRYESTFFNPAVIDADGKIQCVGVQTTLASVYQYCLPARVCQGGPQTCIGSNRGMLCGQCGPGETYHGFFSGRRLCQACPPTHVVVLRVIGIVLVYLLVGAFVSRLSERAAGCEGNLPNAMFRSFVHYMHLMACVCELTKLDANPVASLLLTPTDLLWRPMELAQVSCLNVWKEQVSEADIFWRHEILMSLGMVPIGVAFLLFIHLVATVLWAAWHQVKLWVCGYAQAAHEQVMNTTMQAAGTLRENVRSSVSEALLLDQLGQDSSPASVPSKAESSEAAKQAGAEVHSPSHESSASPRSSSKATKERQPSKGSSDSPKVRLQRSSSSVDLEQQPRRSSKETTVQWADQHGQRLSTVAGRTSGRSRSSKGAQKEGDGEPKGVARRSSLTQDTLGSFSGRLSREKGAQKEGDGEPEGVARRSSLKQATFGSPSGRLAREKASQQAEEKKKHDEEEEMKVVNVLYMETWGREETPKLDKHVIMPEVPAFMRKEEFATNGSMARSFRRAHSFRNIRLKIDKFWRETLVLVLLAYPQTLRTLMRLGTCVPVGPEREWRLLMDLDVECTHLHMASYQSQANALLLCLPVVIGAILFYQATDLLDMRNRRVVCILTGGYKFEAFYWEVLVFLRIGILIRLMSFEQYSLRCFLMMTTLIGFFTLDMMVEPFQASGRWALGRFDTASSIGLLMVAWLGVSLQEEVDPELGAIRIDEGGWYFGLGVILWNVGAVLLATFRSIVVETFIDLQVIVDLGGSLSWTLRHITRLIVATYGIHPVIYYKDSISGKEILDASRLNSRERKFLVYSLTETIRACMDSAGELHPWKVEMAIHEALQRAKEARTAKMMNYYYTHGSRTRTLGCLPCFETTFPDPDIELVDDKISSSIYIEELHAALKNVCQDVLDHAGSISESKLVAVEDEGDGSDDGERVHLSTWGQGDDLDNLEQDLQTKGVMLLRNGSRGRDDDHGDHQRTSASPHGATEDSSSVAGSEGHPEDARQEEMRTLTGEQDRDVEQEKESRMSELNLQKILEQLESEIDELEEEMLAESRKREEHSDSEPEVDEDDREEQFQTKCAGLEEHEAPPPPRASERPPNMDENEL